MAAAFRKTMPLCYSTGSYKQIYFVASRSPWFLIWDPINQLNLVFKGYSIPENVSPFYVQRIALQYKFYTRVTKDYRFATYYTLLILFRAFHEKTTPATFHVSRRLFGRENERRTRDEKPSLSRKQAFVLEGINETNKWNEKNDDELSGDEKKYQ